MLYPGSSLHKVNAVTRGARYASFFWTQSLVREDSQRTLLFEYWSHTHLTVDVVTGRGSGFSAEAPEGVRFLIRSRLMETVSPFA